MRFSDPIPKILKSSYKILFIALLSFIVMHLAGAHGSVLLLIIFTGSLVIGIPGLLLGLILIFFRLISPSIPGVILQKSMLIIYSLATIIVSIMITAILLNYIPVKFAVKLDDAQKDLKYGKYICETDPYTFDVEWYTNEEMNKHLQYGLHFKVSGVSPDKLLSEKTFDFKFSQLSNQYLLEGDVKNSQGNKEKGNLSADLHVNKWQIIYPINRATFRQYFAPRGYLTVYDYDWIKVIKSLSQ